MNKKLGIVLIVVPVGAYVLNQLAHRLGATEEEVQQILPGDEIVSQAIDQTTHAVTIRAPASDIWPWLVQAGYHRGGWYDNEKWGRLMDRLVWQVIVPPGERAEYRPSANRVIPEFQHLEVGDVVPDGPPGTAFFNVIAIEPNQFLVLHSTSHIRYAAPGFLKNTALEPFGEFSWVFVLNELEPGLTRLILRTRFKYGPLIFRLFTWPFFIIGETFFPYQILTGIKQRVERTTSTLS